MTNSQTIGKRIRQVRETKNITQGDFAEMVGKDQRTISEYENGKRRISALDLLDFAHALDVSVLAFYEGEFSQDDFDRALLDEFHKLSNPTKIATLEILRTLVKLDKRNSPTKKERN